VEVDAAYTNKPPGGVAYRCSFRVTEAVHAIERMADIAAHEIGMDPADFRLRNFIQPDQFPYHTPTGWEYDSGDYHAALQKALDLIGYDELRREQAEKRARGELMGIGISSFTEIVGAGPSHTFDLIGIKMFDSAEIRVHPTGSAILRLGVQSQGQGHETTFAQIVAEELGIPPTRTPSRRVTPTPRRTAWGPTPRAPRRWPGLPRPWPPARSATRPEDRRPPPGGERGRPGVDERKFAVRGSPEKSKTIAEIAFAAYTNHPQGMEAGLEAVDYYDPPNLTFPFGSYICVVDIDRGTDR